MVQTNQAHRTLSLKLLSIILSSILQESFNWLWYINSFYFFISGKSGLGHNSEWLGSGSFNFPILITQSMLIIDSSYKIQVFQTIKSIEKLTEPLSISYAHREMKWDSERVIQSSRVILSIFITRLWKLDVRVIQLTRVILLTIS